MLNLELVSLHVKSLAQEYKNWMSGNKHTECLTTNDFTSKMEKEYEYLAKNAKTLFNMCLNDIDIAQFDDMIARLKRVKAGEITEYNAAVEFGTKMRDKYIPQ